MKAEKFAIEQGGGAMAAWRRAFERCQELLLIGNVEVSIKSVKGTRSLKQNDCMWAMLKDVSNQIMWPVDGEMQHLSAEEWKHIFSSALSKETRVAVGLEGGFVVLGKSTSSMTQRQMSEMIDIIGAFGADRDIVWTDPNMQSMILEYGGGNVQIKSAA